MRGSGGGGWRQFAAACASTILRPGQRPSSRISTASNAPRRTIRLMATTAAPELVSVTPATLEPVGSVRRTDPGELPGIVAASRAAQERWWAAGPSARAKVLREAARIVRVHADAIADAIVAETAKPRTEAIANELYAAVDHARWLAKQA